MADFGVPYQLVPGTDREAIPVNEPDSVTMTINGFSVFYDGKTLAVFVRLWRFEFPIEGRNVRRAHQKKKTYQYQASHKDFFHQVPLYLRNSPRYRRNGNRASGSSTAHCAVHPFTLNGRAKITAGVFNSPFFVGRQKRMSKITFA
jgi:hypothetical protein